MGPSFIGAVCLRRPTSRIVCFFILKEKEKQSVNVTRDKNELDEHKVGTFKNTPPFSALPAVL